MDEPFAALDPVNREVIQDEFLRMQRQAAQDDPVREPRHRRGGEDGRPHRDLPRRAARAVRGAGRIARASGRRVRRELRRQRSHAEAAAPDSRARSDGAGRRQPRSPRARRRSRRTTTCAASPRCSSSTVSQPLRCVDADGQRDRPRHARCRSPRALPKDARVVSAVAHRAALDACRTSCSAASRSRSRWGSTRAGSAPTSCATGRTSSISRKQHLVLVGISGSLAIVSGVAHRHLAVAAVDGALGRRRDPGGQHGRRRFRRSASSR